MSIKTQYETLILLQGHGTLTIELSRPEVHHALNALMIEELTQAFKEASDDNQTRCIILTASGGTFCAGADLNWMKASVDLTQEQNQQDAEKLAELFLAAHHCKKPIIGRINGSAYGGGLGLISICDLAVCITNAKFCFSEVKLGLVPAVISPFILQKMQPSFAKELMLTAQVFDSEIALKSGLVQALGSTADELNEKTDAWVSLILKAAPQAVKLTKQLLNALPYQPNLQTACKLTTQLIAAQRSCPEGQEGLAAFIEKRKPSWITEN